MPELTFKSEEDRMTALNAVPEVDDAPPGEDLDEFRLKIDQDIDDITGAKILKDGEEPPADPPPADPPQDPPPADPPADPPPADPPPADPPITPEKARIELLENQNRYLEEQRVKDQEAHDT